MSVSLAEETVLANQGIFLTTKRRFADYGQEITGLVHSEQVEPKNQVTAQMMNVKRIDVEKQQLFLIYVLLNPTY